MSDDMFVCTQCQKPVSWKCREHYIEERRKLIAALDEAKEHMIACGKHTFFLAGLEIVMKEIK